MLLSGQNWKYHRGWFLLFLIGTLGSSAWFFFTAWSNGWVWPGGSSLPGITFGTLGGLLITFEMLLSWRKRYRTMRVGRTQVWMRAHIWLGLLTGPLLVYHSGFRLGAWLSTVILALLIVVLLSGLWGLYIQNRLPTHLLEDVPAETIYSQMDRIRELMYLESERVVSATCGPSGNPRPQLRKVSAKDLGDEEAHITIGRVRSAGLVQGKVMQTKALAQPVAHSEPLREFFDKEVIGYLLATKQNGSPLNSPNKSNVLFDNVRAQVDPKAHDAVNQIQSVVDQRRQFETQASLYFWLHNWLWVHQPLSWMLFIFMLLHVVVALMYA